MTSLVNLGMKNIPQLAVDISENFTEMYSHASRVRGDFLSKDLIGEFSKNEVPSSIITVDGACVTQSLAGIDLIDTCAVSAEGMGFAQQYDSDSSPKLYWGGYMADHVHTGGNIATSVMSLQELLLLEHPDILEYDMRVIDGSWTSALIAVAVTLQRDVNGSALINDALLDAINSNEWLDGGMRLVDSIKRRNRPWLSEEELRTVSGGIMVAISKSDSQKAYTKFLTDMDSLPPSILGMGDRRLASLVLEPGEMMPIIDMPMRLPQGVGQSSAIHLAGWSELTHRKDKKAMSTLKPIYDELKKLISTDGSSILSISDLNRLINERWIFSTYFKPLEWSRYGRPLKVDFLRPAHISPNEDGFEKKLSEWARKEIIGRLAQDFSPLSKEPMSQYFADTVAKEISTVSQIRKNSLLSQSHNDGMISAIIGRYRT